MQKISEFDITHNYAGFWVRVCANIIDSIFFFPLIFSILGVVFGLIMGSAAPIIGLGNAKIIGQVFFVLIITMHYILLKVLPILNYYVQI